MLRTCVFADKSRHGCFLEVQERLCWRRRGGQDKALSNPATFHYIGVISTKEYTVRILTYVSEGEPEEDYQPRINKWVIASTSKRQPVIPNFIPKVLDMWRRERDRYKTKEVFCILPLSHTHFNNRYFVCASSKHNTRYFGHWSQMMHYAYGVSKEFPGYLYIAHSSSRRSIKFSKDNCILYTGLASTHHLGI